MPLCGRKPNKMFIVYILKSIRLGKYYIGHTDNLTERLARHNRGAIKSTKFGKPWKVVYTEEWPTRSEAYRRELEIKGYKGGVQFKQLILSSGKSGGFA
jgi:putative endonuclease